MQSACGVPLAQSSYLKASSLATTPPPWVSYDSNFAIYVSRSRRSNTQLSDHLLFQSLHHKPYSCMMSRVMVVGRHVFVHL